MDGRPPRIEPFRNEWTESLSRLIVRDLLEVNIRDYGEASVRAMAERFAPERLPAMFAGRPVVFVALLDDRPVGTLSVASDFHGGASQYVFLTVFVDPDLHGRGIGRALMEAGEAWVRDRAGTRVRIPSSVHARDFYARFGYVPTGDGIPDSDGIIFMEKILDE